MKSNQPYKTSAHPLYSVVLSNVAAIGSLLVFDKNLAIIYSFTLLPLSFIIYLIIRLWGTVIIVSSDEFRLRAKHPFSKLDKGWSYPIATIKSASFEWPLPWDFNPFSNCYVRLHFNDGTSKKHGLRKLNILQQRRLQKELSKHVEIINYGGARFWN